MNAELLDLVESGKISSQIATKLESFQPGSFCYHRSWGAGQVKSIDKVMGQLIIDFTDKKNHPLGFEFAAQSLTSLSPEHIESKVLADKEGMLKVSQDNPAEIIRLCILSFGKNASVERIEKALVPALVSDWKKWWESARRAIKKDGTINVPTKKKDPLTIQEASANTPEGLLERLQSTNHVPGMIAFLEETKKNWKNINSPELAQQIITHIDEALEKLPKSKMHHVVELALVRDEAVKEFKVSTDSALSKYVGAHNIKLANLLSEMTPSRQNGLLERLPEVRQDWDKLLLDILAQSTTKVAEIIYQLFKKAGRTDELMENINRLILTRTTGPDLLIWICKNRDEDTKSLVSHQILFTMLSVMELEQASQSRRSRLQDLMHTDTTLVQDMLKPASDGDVKDITRAFLISPGFDELSKRSLLARILKAYPFVESMIVKGEAQKASDDDSEAGANTYIVSWDSLNKTKKEYEEVINKKIPENTKDIAIARSYGDMRENHEFKAAKEMQTVLMRRKAELESMLARAQGTDFKGVKNTAVGIGTIVTLKSDSKEIVYTILGAWDSVPEKGVISYLTALAQTLLGKKVGDVVELPLENSQTQKVTIEKIVAFNP